MHSPTLLLLFLSLCAPAALAHWWGGQPSPAWPGPSRAQSSPSAIAPSPTFANASLPAPICLTAADADLVAQSFARPIANYTADNANSLLAEGFIDQSSSVNSLIDGGSQSPIPLRNLTFASKVAFMAAQAGQPNIPFEILNMWYNCDTVIVRWLSAQSPQPVQGISVNEVRPSSNASLPRFQITATYAEVNTVAWLANLGRPECNV